MHKKSFLGGVEQRNLFSDLKINSHMRKAESSPTLIMQENARVPNAKDSLKQLDYKSGSRITVQHCVEQVKIGDKL